MSLEIEISVHSYKDLEIGNALVILSFPTTGMISSVVANYLIENLDLERIGAFLSEDFQPVAKIDDGVPGPSIQIYGGKHVCGPQGKQCDQLIIIKSDLEVENKYLNTMSDEILEWCRENNCEVIVTIEGINKEDMEFGDDPNIFWVSSNDVAKSYIEELDAKQLKNGIVAGLSGLLLWKGNYVDFPVTGILSEANPNYPDSRSAAAVLSVIDKMLPEIEMNTQPLLEQAEKIEDQIRESYSQIKKSPSKPKTKPSRGFFA